MPRKVVAPKDERRRQPRATTRDEAFQPDVIEMPWWRTRSLRPVIVLAQPEATYAPLPGLIRQDPDSGEFATYLARLIETIHFADQFGADFCVFPEFSWPYAAVTALKKAFKETSRSCVYILPFEHLTVEQYKDALQRFGVLKSRRENEAMEIARRLPVGMKNGVINAALILVPRGKKYEVYPQRKLRPAKLEEWGALTPRFVKGETIRVFRGANCTFAVMICFDFINRDDALLERPRDVLMRKNLELDIVFVPECNPQPLHDFYLMSTIDLYQSPAWAQHRPWVVLNNVARTSRLPEYPTNFGFTRLIGSIGKVMDSTELVKIPGYLSAPDAVSLEGLRNATVSDPKTHTLLLRPEQSVFRCVLSPLGSGAVQSREVGDLNTEVEIYRPLGPFTEWERVRELPAEKASDAREIPDEYRTDLSGHGDLQKRFRELLANETLLVVRGELGAGKTALVSTTIHEITHRDNGDDPDRVVWIDLATIEHSEEALVEEILIRLQQARALTTTLTEQYATLTAELRRKPTVLVLDSADSWPPDKLPLRILKLHGWKILVVVAGRFKPPSMPESTCVFEVAPLTPAEFAHVARSTAGRDIPTSLAFAMYVSSGGSALHAVWTGQFVGRNHAEAEQLNDYVWDKYARFLGTVPRQVVESEESDGAVISSMENQKAIRIDDIYTWFQTKIPAAAFDLLEVLCELRSGMRSDDLAKIVGRPIAAIQEMAVKLEQRNLVITLNTGGDRGVTQHSAHPFMRHIWSESGRKLNPVRWRGVIDWVASVLDQYKRDRDPRVSPVLTNQWPNIAHVLQKLAESKDRKERQHFLRLWGAADEFLWAAGRWREKISFGRTAEKVAKQIGDVRAEIEALYDAQAKTIWHRSGTKYEAADLLRRAATIADAKKERALRARIEWYVSRMHLHVDEAPLGLEAAKNAVRLADRSKDLATRMFARVGLGNAQRENGDLEKAEEAYEEARALTDKLEEVRRRESRAAIDRNIARIARRRRDFASALKLFESAMNEFRALQLVVQEAETAVYYAETLATIGEASTAERYLAWGRRRLDPLGSKLRQNDITTADQAIAAARQRRTAATPAAR